MLQRLAWGCAVVKTLFVHEATATEPRPLLCHDVDRMNGRDIAGSQCHCLILHRENSLRGDPLLVPWLLMVYFRRTLYLLPTNVRFVRVRTRFPEDCDYTHLRVGLLRNHMRFRYLLSTAARHGSRFVAEGAVQKVSASASLRTIVSCKKILRPKGCLHCLCGPLTC
jgi:hypothetical protein